MLFLYTEKKVLLRLQLKTYNLYFISKYIIYIIIIYFRTKHCYKSVVKVHDMSQMFRPRGMQNISTGSTYLL